MLDVGREGRRGELRPSFRFELDTLPLSLPPQRSNFSTLRDHLAHDLAYSHSSLIHHRCSPSSQARSLDLDVSLPSSSLPRPPLDSQTNAFSRFHLLSLVGPSISSTGRPSDPSSSDCRSSSSSETSKEGEGADRVPVEEHDEQHQDWSSRQRGRRSTDGLR